MLSLIIPSYNPGLKLTGTLDCLISQAEYIYELIIVMDEANFHKFPVEKMESYSKVFNLKIVKQGSLSRSKSRNRGAEESKGTLLIFLDDDMLAEKDLVQKHVRYHTEKQDLIVTGNGYRNPADANYDFGQYLVKMEQNWKQKIKGKEVNFANFHFTACNMSLSKKLFEQMNGFDTRFTDGEDFDFAVRALNKGISILYDGDLLAWHNDWTSIDAFIRRQKEYAKAKFEILKVHPDYAEHFPRLQIRESSPVKKLFSFIVRKTIAPWVVSGKGLFKLLPLKVKFLFYRLTISSYAIVNS